MAYASLAGAGQAAAALVELEPDHGVRSLRGLAAPARKIWYSPNSDLLAAVSDDWQLGVWQVDPARLKVVVETPVGSYADSAGGQFDRRGSRFAFAAGQEARIYDLASGRTLQRWSLKRGVSDTLCWSDELLLLRLENDMPPGRVRWRLYQLGDKQDPTLLREQNDPNLVPRSAAFSKDGRRFLVWTHNPNISVHAYETRTGRELWATSPGSIPWNVAVIVDPTGELFGYTAWKNRHMRLVRFSDFQQVADTSFDCEAVAPSGRQFANNGWFFPDRSGTKAAVPLMDIRVSIPTFSPDGKRLAWCTEQGVVCVADLEQVQQRLARLGRSRSAR